MKKHPLYPWLVFAVVGLGTFMATLDSSIVNVALPTISHSLHTSLPVLQWVVTVYLLTISGLLPIFGSLGDSIGRKRVYVTGFLVFILGSALCGFSRDITFLVFSRIVQGIGGAMMMANNMGIVASAFPSNQRGKALGSTGTVVAAGTLTGPALGGFLVSHFSWPSIFLINLPIGILGFFLGTYFLEESEKSPSKGFDILGAVLFLGGITSLLIALAQGNKWGWLSYPIIMLFLSGIVILVAFIFWEKKINNPLIDLSLYGNPFFAAANLAGLISYILLFSVNVLMPFYLDHVLNYSPVRTGLFMTPIPLALALIAPLSGRLSDRIGPIFLTCVGMGVMGLGLSFLAQLSLHSTPGEIYGKMLVVGIGMALFTSPNNSSIMGSVPRDKLGVVGGLIATYRNIGMLLGIALSVAIFTIFFNSQLKLALPYQEAFIFGLSKTYWLAVLLSLAGLLLSTVRARKGDKNKIPGS